MQDYYIGLMSGTSLDGIDAALVHFNEKKPQLIAQRAQAWSASIKQQLQALRHNPKGDLFLLGQLDQACALELAQAVLALLKQAHFSAEQIKAIGCHGQTIYHHPHPPYPFTWQLANPHLIAAQTGIRTIADFRRADMAVGGQGAPLVPAFHQAVFTDKRLNRVILNIGGIANITYLPAGSDQVIGFDTGPGNTLMDQWIKQQLGKDYDQDGNWAASGQVIPELLAELLADPYFQQAPPKSTGTEYFNLSRFDFSAHDAVDVQATLLELTVQSIVQSLQSFRVDEIYICGGGLHNRYLIQRLQALLPISLHSSAKLGIEPDWVEAMAFAWLAQQRLAAKPANLPAVTGAKKRVLLGIIYEAL